MRQRGAELLGALLVEFADAREFQLRGLDLVVELRDLLGLQVRHRLLLFQRRDLGLHFFRVALAPPQRGLGPNGLVGRGLNGLIEGGAGLAVLAGLGEGDAVVIAQQPDPLDAVGVGGERAFVALAGFEQTAQSRRANDKRDREAKQVERIQRFALKSPRHVQRAPHQPGR